MSQGGLFVSLDSAGEEVCGSGGRHCEDHSAGQAGSPGLLQDQGTAVQGPVSVMAG